jgi:hypothetical protein
LFGHPHRAVYDFLMNLKDLNTNILDLMSFSKVKDLVKNLAEKLEFSSQKVDELSAENKELKSRM